MRADPVQWGRQVETTLGAHLLNSSPGTPTEVMWWRERDAEVDFALRRGGRLLAMEVNSFARSTSQPRLRAFVRQFPGARTLEVGGGGVELAAFLAKPAEHWLEWAG